MVAHIGHFSLFPVVDKRSPRLALGHFLLFQLLLPAHLPLLDFVFLISFLVQVGYREQAA